MIGYAQVVPRPGFSIRGPHFVLSAQGRDAAIWMITNSHLVAAYETTLTADVVGTLIPLPLPELT